MNLIQIAELTETQAREYFENVLWPDGRSICPKCNNKDGNYQIESIAARAGLRCCKKCRKQFTVKVDTIMHRSKLSYKQWLLAYYLVCSSKKSIASIPLAENLGITQKSAWFMAHRIRLSMEETDMGKKMLGTIEVDETYIGGKPKPGDNSKRGRGTKKIPVVVLIERGGKAKSHSVKRVDGKTLKGAIRDNVSKKAMIMTDDWKSYRGLEKEFEGGHGIIPHGDGIYSSGNIHVNTAESYFAILKRGVYGIFHHVSKEHLDRYCVEFTFRWNHRKETNKAKVTAAIKGMTGKRLIYREMKSQ